MSRAQHLAAGLAACFLASAAAAQGLDRLDEKGRAGLAAFRQLGFNKAFAVNADRRWAYVANHAKPADAAEAVLKRCNEGAKSPCRIVLFNDVDSEGRDPLSLPAAAPDAQPIGPLTPSAYYPVRGPQAAAGLLIWSHGVLSGADSTLFPPHGYVNRFRDAGFDVYDFDRRWPNHNKDLSTLHDAVRQARALGYRRVILAGQSAGAWLSLEAAARGAPVDGAIAAAPARFGKEIGAPRREKNREDLMPVLEALGGREVAVALMFFAGDEYEPGGRPAQARDIFSRSHKARTLLIAEPEGITGHGGGAASKFVLGFGACLADFILTGERRKPCEEPP